MDEGFIDEIEHDVIDDQYLVGCVWLTSASRLLTIRLILWFVAVDHKASSFLASSRKGILKLGILYGT
jgi:hypothetical protein